MSSQIQFKNEPSGEVSSLTKLFELLDLQDRHCRIFIQLLNQEKQILIDMGIQLLISLTSKKAYQLQRINGLDKAIREISRRICGEAGPTKFKLTEIIPYLDQHDGARLQSHCENLAGLREEIKTKNLINKQFTMDTLKYIDNGITLITGGIAEERRYQNKGTIRNLPLGPALINREV